MHKDLRIVKMVVVQAVKQVNGVGRRGLQQRGRVAGGQFSAGVQAQEPEGASPALVEAEIRQLEGGAQ